MKDMFAYNDVVKKMRFFFQEAKGFIEVPAQSNTIEFIMLGILLISIGFIRQSEGARMSLFIRSFVNESLASQQIRQERSFNRMAIPVFIISGFSVSLFVAQIAIQSDRFEGIW